MNGNEERPYYEVCGMKPFLPDNEQEWEKLARLDPAAKKIVSAAENIRCESGFAVYQFFSVSDANDFHWRGPHRGYFGIKGQQGLAYQKDRWRPDGSELRLFCFAVVA